MSKPVFLHSGMMGAPSLTHANGTVNALLNACLVNGFNMQSVVSATASGGVVTFNYASAPGFSALDTVTIAGSSGGVADGKFRVQSAASNQVLVAIPGVPDGAVGGTITMKFSPLGWTRPYSGTQIGCYRQGGSEGFNRFLRVRDNTITTTGGGLFNYRGYENMTAASSGTGPFPTTVQVSGDGPQAYGPRSEGVESDASARPWVIVGTPRAFYMCLAHVTYSFTGGHPKDVFQFGTASGFFFGDLAEKAKPSDAFHTLLCNSASAPWGTGGSSGYFPRAVTGAAGAVVSRGFTPNDSTYPNRAMSGLYPSPANGGMRLTGNIAQADEASGALRGNMPGLLFPYESPDGAFLTGATLDNVAGVTGRLLYLSPSAVASYSQAFVALDEDWGDV